MQARLVENDLTELNTKIAMQEGEDEKHARQLNKTAEDEAELNRVKAQLLRRIAAAMKEIPGVAENERFHQGMALAAKPLSCALSSGDEST